MNVLNNINKHIHFIDYIVLYVNKLKKKKGKCLRIIRSIKKFHIKFNFRVSGDYVNSLISQNSTLCALTILNLVIIAFSKFTIPWFVSIM